MKHLVSVLLCFFWLLFVPPCGRTEAISYNSVGHDYLGVLYDSSTGFSSSEANDILQTPDGFIWIASYSGLFRYDGKNFFRISAQNRITNAMNLFTDSRGRLWIGTNDNGLVISHRGKYTSFTEDEGLTSNTIRDMCELRDGSVVVATAGGINLIRPNNVVETPDDPRLEAYIASLTPTPDGFAGLTRNGDFFMADGDGTVRFIPSAAFGDTPSALRYSEDAGLVIGTTSGQVLDVTIEGDTPVITRRRNAGELSSINCFCPGVNGVLWVCGDKGVGFFDRYGALRVLKGLKVNSSIKNMTIDYEGNLWLASTRQGIFKVVQNRFLNIATLVNLPDTVVNAVLNCHDTLSVATDSGLYVIRDGKRVETPLSTMLAGTRIRHIMQDTAGRLWLSTYSNFGLLMQDTDGRIRTFTKKDGMPSERIRSTARLANGDIVAATRNGLIFLHDEEIVAVLGDKDGLENAEILTLWESSDGNLYAGSDGGGLYIIKDRKIIGNIGRKQGLRSGVILRVKEDPNTGMLWILTSNSIAVRQKGSIITLPFPSTNVYDLFFLPDGTLWLLGSDGVSITTPEKMLRGEGRLLSYGLADDLPSSVTANSFSELCPNGYLYLCSQRGISSINTLAHTMTPPHFQLAIPTIVVDGKRLPIIDGSVVLPATCRRFSIQGHVLSYGLNNPQVAFWLEGFDESPVYMTRSTITPQTYTNLRGGDYVFHMEVLDPLTGKALNHDSVTICKELTLWEHKENIALAALGWVFVVVAGCWFFLKVRTRTLIRKQEQTRQFLREVIRAFARTIDIKDKYTNGHSLRVAIYAKAIAEELNLPEEQVENVYNMAMLHDVGKIVIPDEVLRKPGKLTDEEYALIKTHAAAGGEILAEIRSFPKIFQGARFHHERCDGSGYPDGLTAQNIPLEARIIAVADTFDAMHSTRPYRQQIPRPEILAELKHCAVHQLDPKVVAALLRLLHRTDWFSGEAWKDCQNSDTL